MTLEEKLYQEGRETPFTLPFPCRIISEFNDALLVARKNLDEVEFITYLYNSKRNGVCFGHYGLTLEGARRDFAIRSGLVESEEFLTKEEKLAVGDACHYAIQSGAFIPKGEEILDKVLEKIDYDTLVDQRKEEKKDYFSQEEMEIIHETCDHHYEYSDLPEAYKEVLTDVFWKVGQSATRNEIGEKVLPLDCLKLEEKLVIGDAIDRALDYWDNCDTAKALMKGILAQITFTESEQEALTDLEISLFESDTLDFDTLTNEQEEEEDEFDR